MDNDSTPESSTSDNYHTKKKQSSKDCMRWWFFGVSILLSIIWMVGMIILSMHVFDVSRNPLSLSISAVGLLPLEVIRRFADYLLPMDDKRFELEKMKIQSGYRTLLLWHQKPKQQAFQSVETVQQDASGT